MKVILTITTCKRIDFFKRTINSFLENCDSKDLIDEVMIFDDSSSNDDRHSMFEIIMEKFHDKKISFVFFEEKSFDTNLRHREIIKIWKKKIEEFDFCFHLEDDWECLKKFKFEEDIEFLKKNKKILAINYTHNLPTYQPEILNFGNSERYWRYPYEENLVKVDYWWNSYFDDTVHYLVPPFSLRPSIFDVKKLRNLEIANTHNFEYHTGILMGEKYDLYLTNELIFKTFSLENESAYIINNSKR